MHRLTRRAAIPSCLDLPCRPRVRAHRRRSAAMSDLRTAGLDRRRFLAVGGLVGAGAVLASCTSNDPDTAGNNNEGQAAAVGNNDNAAAGDRKSTRLNSSHMSISYAVFC